MTEWSKIRVHPYSPHRRSLIRDWEVVLFPVGVCAPTSGIPQLPFLYSACLRSSLSLTPDFIFIVMQGQVWYLRRPLPCLDLRHRRPNQLLTRQRH